jgi:hypothetical protein
MQIGFFFNTEVPAEAEMIERNLEFERRQRTGVNEEGLRHILGTETGKRIVLGAAEHFRPRQIFSRAILAAAIGEPESSVFSWIRQLGRPEARYGMRVFEKHSVDDETHYSLSQPIFDAICRIRDERLDD